MSDTLRPKDNAHQESAANIEAAAFLTRMRGLSSDGIIQALADIGWDSGHMAREITRLYESSDEKLYRQKLLAMIVDLMKQKEGQRIKVDDFAAASDTELAGMEATLIAQLQAQIGGQLDAPPIIDDRRRLPCPEPRSAETSEPRKGKKGRRDSKALPANADAGKVSPKPGANTRLSWR